jgi:type II secretory pathway pseudopilin PulG
MKSIRCTQCGLIQWETASTCKRCGLQFGHPANLAGAPNAASTTALDGTAPWAAQGKKKIGLAVLSLVTGIMSVPPVFSFVMLIFGGILALLFGVPGFIVGAIISLGVIPTALVSGIVALGRIRNRPHEYGGKGLAVGGIACSSAGLVVIPLIAAIAIPNLFAARRAANEGSAISSLRTIYSAQSTYLATVGAGSCGELHDLSSAGLIPENLASGNKSGYKFELAFDDRKRDCYAYATPQTSSTGTRSFLVSSDGVIHAGEKHGARAELKDPVLSN